MEAAKALLQTNSYPKFLALVLVLSLPHVFYAIVWLRSEFFISVCKRVKCVPINMFSGVAFGLKAIQFLCFFVWLISNGSFVSAESFSFFRILPAALLMGAGQLLNSAVYKTLGHDGVYYGVKFGKTIPWVEGFPFNMGIKSPQYTGCILSICGMVIFVSTPDQVAAGIVPIGIIWSGFYIFSAVVEDYF